MDANHGMFISVMSYSQLLLTHTFSNSFTVSFMTENPYTYAIMISFYGRNCPCFFPGVCLCAAIGLQQPNVSPQPRGKIPTVHVVIARKLMWSKNFL